MYREIVIWYGGMVLKSRGLEFKQRQIALTGDFRNAFYMENLQLALTGVGETAALSESDRASQTL